MKIKRDITILAIETSCDDTGIAIIKASKRGNSFDVLSNLVSSQTEIHKKYGGVYPMMAKREHQRNLLPVLIQALKESKLLKETKKQKYDFKAIKEILKREEILYKNLVSFLQNHQKPDIDAIAVTNGPGLEPCLWVGTNFAKALASFWNLPIITVNHIKAHIFVNMLENGKIKELAKNDFPVLCLIVSGGHTQLFLMKNINEYKIIGETRDDAAGECFDKTARILGLGYPGGPAISAEADKLEPGYKPEKLPRPMINSKNYDFSFSGLKTAVLYNYLKKSSKTKKDKKYIQAMASEIQQSVIDVLIKKTIKAAKDFEAKSIVLGGGVIANQELRKQFKEKIQKLIPNTKCLIPDNKYCTDNGLMVAIAGYFKFRKNETENWKSVGVNANLRIE